MINCKLCNFISLSVAENANHTRWKHYRENEIGTKFLKYVCCLECKEETTTQSFKAHLKKHENSKIVKSKCLECNKEMFKPHKFCSQSCAAKYNNSRKDYTLFKTGPKPGHKHKARATKPQFTKIKPCVVCGKYHPRSGKTCSDYCKNKLLSIKASERIDNGWNPQEHRCRSKPSFLEKSFENWLKQLNYTSYIKNKTFRCNKKIYYGDFYFPKLNLLIELDGKQHKHTIEYDSERDSLILEFYLVRTIRISYKEYMEKSKLACVLSLLLEHPTGFEPA